MSNDENINDVRKDNVIEVSHLLWEIPTKLHITSDGKFYINNGHGGQLREVDRQYIEDFLATEIAIVNEHLEFLVAIQKLL